MNQKHQYPVLIRENHLDTFGHVNNATYLQLFEEARWQLVTENSYGLDKIKETGLGPTILEVTIRFIREITLRQRIVIETELADYERKVGTIKQAMVNEAGEICCTADFKFGLFDLRTRKLVGPTQDWAKALGIKQLE